MFVYIGAVPSGRNRVYVGAKKKKKRAHIVIIPLREIKTLIRRKTATNYGTPTGATVFFYTRQNITFDAQQTPRRSTRNYFSRPEIVCPSMRPQSYNRFGVVDRKSSFVCEISIAVPLCNCCRPETYTRPTTRGVCAHEKPPHLTSN